MTNLANLLSAATPRSIFSLFTRVSVSALVLLTVSCAGNQTGNQPVAGDPNVECLTMKLTGTNIPKRYCRTKSEWEALSSNDRDVAREYMRQTTQRSGILEQEVGGSAYD